MKDRSAADPRILWGFWAAAAAGILLFAFLLRGEMRSVHPLDPTDYTEPAPEGFAWQCDVTPGQGILTLQGWAAVEGEKPETVDCFYVLYSAGEEAYYRLPTTMQQSDAAAAGAGTPYAGLYGFALTEQLPAGELELCFAYRSNGHNALIHTGRMVGGAA